MYTCGMLRYIVLIDTGGMKFYDSEYDSEEEALKRARSIARSIGRGSSGEVIVCEETSSVKSKTSSITVIVCKEVSVYPKRGRQRGRPSQRRS